MIEMLNSLEFRFYRSGKIFINELDECMEMLFVEQGTFEVGYLINNKKYFAKLLGVGSIIGGYQICNDKRFEFIYRTKTQMQGQAIRKEQLKQILKKWPHFRH